jgi:hypothetical protein
MPREPEFSPRDALQVLGHPMVNDRGDVIGCVKDVVPDLRANDDFWAVVGVGLFRSEHFVPLVDARVKADGTVVVPYDKSTVKHAPPAVDHVLLPAVRAHLDDYYGIP